MRSLTLMALGLLLGSVTLATAHEIPTDYSREACVPVAAGARLEADFSCEQDAATGEFVISSRDERGPIAYRVLPGRPDGSNGLFSVRASVGGGGPFTIAPGVMLTMRDLQGRNIGLDGRRLLSAFDFADVDADGPGGYMREPSGHGPCIRIGDTLPVEPHTQGHVTVPLEVEPGRWMVGVRYMDDRDDVADDAFIALSVGGAEIGRIMLDLDDDAWHERLFAAELQGGEVLRVDARSDAGGEDYCRISQIILRPADGPGVELEARQNADGAIVIRQTVPLLEGLPRLSASITPVGRSLQCILGQEGQATAPAGVVEMTLLPSTDVPDPRLIPQPFLLEPVVMTGDGVFYSAFVDRFNSHCTEYRPRGAVSAAGADCFGSARYLPDSADALNDFSETLWLTASDRHLDVLPSFAGREASSGRADIGHRVVFDHWRMAPGAGLERQIRIMAGCGMTDLLAIPHTWMRYGYDRKQPQFSPANPERWTDEEFAAAISACHDFGWRVAVHENYNHMDWDSPYNTPTPAREFGEPDRPGDPGPDEALALVTSCPGEDLSRQPRNAWAFSRLADLRVSMGPLTRPSPPAFPIAADKMLFYSEIESHKIREMYGTSAGYLDVTPTNAPGLGTWSTHIDLDARNRNSRDWASVYRGAWRLFDHHRSIFEITTGEGGGSATYHAGHIDAVEREVRGRMAAPLLPEHELRVIRPLSLHHGMGYYSRFFDADAPSSSFDFDLYRAMQVAFGHAGFMGDAVFAGNIPGPEAIREYYLMRALQEAYADAELLAVEYRDGERWISAEEALAAGMDLNRARLRVSYAGNLQIALNFDREADWAVQVNGTPHVLPPLGWAAEAPGLSVGTVKTAGGVRDFCASEGWDYRNDRSAVDFGHVVTRASGLPGLSEREAPGLLLCLRDEAERLEVVLPESLRSAQRMNLTVINAGDEVRLPLTVEGVTDRPWRSLQYRGVSPGAIEPVVTWEDARPGTWRLSLAYLYTDPQHPEDTTQLPLITAFDGPPLVIGAAQGEQVEGSFQHNEGFVEARATLRYSASAQAGPVNFELTDLLWGAQENDDHATEVRLVLENAQTGETVELPFASVGEVRTRRFDGAPAEFVFPKRSVTTFEIGG